jgi:hypothetical protein
MRRKRAAKHNFRSIILFFIFKFSMLILNKIVPNIFGKGLMRNSVPNN